MIYILPLNAKIPNEIVESENVDIAYTDINVTSRSKDEFRALSPFLLGPVEVSGRLAQNVENAWQYSKVYEEHLGRYENVSKEWVRWSQDGFDNTRAIRYPMGKGALPKFSLLYDERLSYVEARKRIYAPLYAQQVAKTKQWKKLKKLYSNGYDLIIRDFDAYDHRKQNMNLMDVLNCPTRKCGHGFILAMMLEWGQDFWKMFEK